MTGTYRLSVEIDGVPPLNSADNHHWRKRVKIRNDWYGRIAVKALGLRPKEPLEFAKVRITRCASGKAPDWDNLAHSAKFVLDALQRCQIIASDAPACIGRPMVFWERVKLKEQHTRIQVLECNPHELDLSPWEKQPEEE